ncbi:MAG TPA: ribosome maturation factor RimP [Thermoanaerobaculia bacterium]|nr:ribosome maturation factor RimP [Thermoanaerobaculia bacterium]
MRTNGILDEKTTREIGQIAEENGCRLLAVETAGAGRQLVLRLILDKEQGVTLEDCERVSRDVSPLLDAETTIGHRYHLEVSSPGLDRKLYSAEDARRFVGSRVKVQSTVPVDGARNFRGTLESVDGERLRIVDEDSRKTYNLSFGEIKVARLAPEWPAATGKRSS